MCIFRDFDGYPIDPVTEGDKGRAFSKELAIVRLFLNRKAAFFGAKMLENIGNLIPIGWIRMIQ